MDGFTPAKSWLKKSRTDFFSILIVYKESTFLSICKSAVFKRKTIFSSSRGEGGFYEEKDRFFSKFHVRKTELSPRRRESENTGVGPAKA